MHDMLLEFYKLLQDPFNTTPDPDFLYLSPSHKEALGVILLGVENRAGFMMITGGVGLGKTTVLRSAIQEFDAERVKTIVVFNPCISFSKVIRLIYESLGIELPEGDDQFQIIQRLYQALIEEYKQGNRVVLVIDEAQNMPVDTLEQLRMLSNLESNKDKLIQTILVGQHPELDNLLDTDALRQLKQRISHRATLIKLTKKESTEYIEHRLAIALAAKGSPFTKSAVDQIIKHCAGVPRCINIICNNALISGFGLGQKPIKPALVREVIADFNGRRRSSWKRPVMVSITLLLFASLLLYFYPPGKFFSLKPLRGPTAGTQETVNLTAPPKPQDAPRKPAISRAVEGQPKSNRAEEDRPKLTSTGKPDAAPPFIAPDLPYAPSTGAPVSSKPLQSVSTGSGSVEDASTTGSHSAGPPASGPKTAMPETRSASAPLSEGTAPGPGTPAKGGSPLQEESPTQKTPPATSKPSTEDLKPVGAAAGQGTAIKHQSQPAGAAIQAPPVTKADTYPGGAAQSAVSLGEVSDKQESPDPSQIIDWLINERSKRGGSGAR